MAIDVIDARDRRAARRERDSIADVPGVTPVVMDVAAASP